MFRAPTVVDLVSSSSSEEDDIFPIVVPPGKQAPGDSSNQLDEPMEIEEDEPFATIKQSPRPRMVTIGSALESVLQDLESEEDEAFESHSVQNHHKPEAIDLSQEDDEENISPTDIPSNNEHIDDPYAGSTNEMVMKSKYASVPDREEGELSDDSNFADDESLQQKQMEATYLREAQVAFRKAAMLKMKAVSAPPVLKKKKMKKRKLQDALLPPPMMMGYPPALPPPRQVHQVAPESIVRLHRHVMVDNLADAPPPPPSAVFPPLPPPPILIPPPSTYTPPPLPPPLPPSPPGTKSRQVFVPDDNDDMLMDLESLRAAVKQSVKKVKETPKETNHANVSPEPSPPSTAGPPTVVKDFPVPSKMALGPNSKWTPRVKKPLTACTQTLVINLSPEDCDEMRRRNQEQQMPLDDPILSLKLKIAAREQELRKKQPDTKKTSVPATTATDPAVIPDAVAVAKSHINRLEKRIDELKQLISIKERAQQQQQQHA
ncbi:unnamed protein product [Aphanomyces euteiches]